MTARNTYKTPGIPPLTMQESALHSAQRLNGDIPICIPLGLHSCVYVMSLKANHGEPSVLPQSVITVPAVWKLAEQIGKIQKPNKSAEQIGEVGRIRPAIWGGGGVVCCDQWESATPIGFPVCMRHNHCRLKKTAV